MVQVVGAREVEPKQLKAFFQLEEVQDRAFFPEWVEDLPELGDRERDFLNQVEAGYFNFLQSPPLLEKTIQLSVVSPILFLAGCFLPPFKVITEESIEIFDADGDFIVRGSIDILLLRDDLWLAIIESKKASFSVEAGLPQLLCYMLAQPEPERPSFGVLMTGGEFLFVKLVNGEAPRYATSTLFALRNKRNRDIYDAFSVLKQLMQL
ncbi:MAG: restriction endonuclease subunit R [Synechococcales cyanobacterium RU_4_20]|nr:restriction endonuclease subunit R [Synechococcales cyanobacterium RU_4_20]NJR68177.1 restriction endonuclease subunit R [Synechococcales cyanobacterium CRU_2_2]